MVEDVINRGKLKRDEAASSTPSRYKKNFNNSHTQPTKSVEVHSITTKATFQLKTRREFTSLGITPIQALRKLEKANLIEPLPPRPFPKEPGPYYHPNEHFEYHQGPGHNIDSCVALKHAIKDLIDARKNTKLHGKSSCQSTSHPKKPFA